MKISEKTIIKLTSLENEVLDVIASQLDAPDRAVLLKQFENTIILSRTMTGVGFYVNFSVDKSAPQLLIKFANIGNVTAEIPGLEHGAGFNLYVKDGIVKHLEGYCFDDQWPDPWPNDKPFKVKDMSQVKSA
jgi:hypothetical protein